MPNPAGDPLAVSADQSADAGDKELWAFRRILARGLHTARRLRLRHHARQLAAERLLAQAACTAPATPPKRTSDSAPRGKQLSLSVLYWLQTEAPRADGGTGFPGLRLRPDVTGTPDGLAKSAYIREARRIKAVTTVTEHDVSPRSSASTAASAREDAVGVGSYRIDLHPSTGGDNYIDVASVPYEIPLGALAARPGRNLLPAGKNIGTTHITNGCFRLHPVEWNIGEVAGLLAAFAISEDVEPREVKTDGRLFEDFARVLDAAGVERRWPEVRGY